MSHCAALRELENADLTAADTITIRRLLRLASQIHGFLASFAANASTALREAGGSRPETVIGDILGKSAAHRAARHAHALANAPAMANALAVGAITPDHVDAFAAAAKQNPKLTELDAAVARAAATMPPDQFRDHVKRLAFLHADDGGLDPFDHQRRNTRLKMWTDAEGMYQLRGQFDPERGAQLLAALGAEVERRHRDGSAADTDNDQRMAVALHHLVTRSGGDQPMGVTMNVHVDEQTLHHGMHPDTHLDLDGGGLVPVETLRRLACDALIRPIVVDGHGVPLHIGRSQRLATAAQRAALRAKHPTCAIPGCQVPFRNCQAHHIHWWRHGGRTDLDNMLPVCGRHHHDIHEGGWQVSLDAERRVTFERPPPSSRAEAA